MSKAVLATSSAIKTGSSATAVLSAGFSALSGTMFPVIAAASLVGAAIYVISEASRTAEKANEKMRASFDSYNESKTNLDGVNKKLEETSARIDELNGKDSLTVVEEGELEKLKEVNEQLLIQQDLLNRETNKRAREAAEDAINAYNKNFSIEISKDKTAEYEAQAGITGNNPLLFSDEKNVSAKIAALNQLKELRDVVENERRKAISEKDDEQIEWLGEELVRYNELSGEIKDSIFEQVQSLTEYSNILSQLPKEELAKVDGGQDLLDKINDQVEYIYATLAPDEWNKIQFGKIFGNEDLASAKKELHDLANASNGVGISIDTVREKYPKLAKAISDAGLSVQDFVNIINSGMPKVGDSVEISAKRISDNAEIISGETSKILSSIKSAYDILSSQSSGKSISIDDFNSEELKDYRSALEYVNGTLQLNADKVNELVKAKTDEQIKTNDANKALAQSKYLKNAAEIEKLRKELVDCGDAESKSVDETKNKIKALQEENSSIREVCSGYDLMCTSLLEATGAYQNWLNAQNGSDYGDMFSSALSAHKTITDTYSEDSSISGDFGSLKFKAAIDLIVPDTVDKDDLDAVSSYMDSVNRYLYEGDNGMELDIGQFASDAYEKGLMELDETGENYVVAARKTMEDFANELNLSMPLLQAFFDEMQLKGFEFDWADEASKTIGDLAVSADVAAEKLRELNPDIVIELDVSEAENKADALDEKIEQMQNLKIGADAEEIEYANTIISYCVAQKQQLEDPAILNIDTSKLSDDAAEAVLMIQEFKTAYNELELQKSLGLDTTQAQEEVNALSEKLASSSNDYVVKLKLDTSSADGLNKSIVGLGRQEVLTTFKIDETALLGYKPENKEATLTYNVDSSAVDAYDPENLTRYVDYYVRTFGSVKSSNSGEDTSKSTNSDGKPATVNGTAMANGSWGAKTGGETLVGEINKEIVVNPNTGRWYTVGDHGAEFTNIPKGAIVFNHKQTEALLKYGRVAGRGKALASGNAMVTGGGISVNWKPSNYKSPSNNAQNSTRGSNADSANDAGQKLGLINWIETAIKRVERAINRLKNVATSAYKSISTKLGATYDGMSMVGNELSIQQKAYARYMQEANSVGLSSDLVSLVQNGAIDISKYDEDTQKLIQDYEKWYDAALECDDAIQRLSEDLASLYEDNFNNIEDDFNSQIDLLGHLTNSYESSIDMLDAKGYMSSTKIYAALQDVENQNISTLNKELSALKQSMSEAMNSGEIEMYSEAWYSMQNSINNVKEQLDDAKLSLVEYTNEMRDVEWGYFDYVQDRISQITKESDFLVELMSNSDLHADNGQLTDSGMATMGLHGMNYNTYMAQADQYAAEVLEVNKLLANDPNNTKLIERREELLELQQDSILAAEQEKDAIVGLVQEGIQIELDNLRDLIDTYNDALDSAKNLYDYQKRIKNHTSEISSLQKQLLAYEDDMSEETRAKVQKIQIELSQAKEDLKETEYQQYISDQKKLLDELYIEYETVLNQRLDNVDALIADMIGTVNANTDSINSTLTDVANDVGYTITDGLQSVWNGSTEALNGTLSVYGDGFNERLTAINNVLSQISANVVSMIGSSDKQAQDDIKNSTAVTAPSNTTNQSKPTLENPNTNTQNPVNTQEKPIKVGGKINAGGAKIYSYAGDRRGESQYYSNDPIYTVIGESGGYLRVRWHKLSSGTTGWFKKNDVKAYKTGGLVDYTGLAQLDGTPSKPELVLNAQDTANFIALKEGLQRIAARGISIGSGREYVRTPELSGITDITGMLSKVQNGVRTNNNIDVGGIEINIPIEHIEDYNDFISQLQKDRRFEKYVQSVTVDRLVGSSSLSKHTYQLGKK